MVHVDRSLPEASKDEADRDDPACLRQWASGASHTVLSFDHP
jgi:hypothetical protein